MAQNDKIQLFEDKRIRTAWDEEKEEWYFSIVDVCEVLSGTDNPRRYWSDLKRKLKAEGAVELYEKIVQLKMTAPDGKKRLTDVADTEQLLRIIQSIPSPKAEPFKLWLAQVGRERIEETIDPELTIDRALETYLKANNITKLPSPNKLEAEYCALASEKAQFYEQYKEAKIELLKLKDAKQNVALFFREDERTQHHER